MARQQTQSAGRGKKIDSFYFDVKEIDDANRTRDQKVLIDIYMEKKFSGETPPLATTSIIFTARCDAAKKSRQGSDLDAVLKALRSDLDKHYEIKWEDWFVVTVEPRSPYHGDGSGLVLQWETVNRGVTIGGDVLLRRYNARAEWSHRWEIQPWPESIKKEGRTVACIEATPENLAALEAFRANIDAMRKRLADFVAPDRIAATLKQIAGGNSVLAIAGRKDDAES